MVFLLLLLLVLLLLLLLLFLLLLSSSSSSLSSLLLLLFYSDTRNRFYRVTFKLGDIHQSKLCTITFFMCHYTDFRNSECRPRIGLFRLLIYTMTIYTFIYTSDLIRLYRVGKTCENYF